MKTFTQIGTEIGELVQQKNAAYGGSFAKAGDFLRLLFPDGIPADRFDDALLMVRIFDKQMRIATDKDAFGESPYADIAGYGILGVQLHQQRKDSATWQGSANGPNAEHTLKGSPASADRSTNERTTTNASAKTASEPSPQPASFSVKLTDANAPTATDAASRSVDDQVRQAQRNNLCYSYERWLYRHNTLRCAACETSVMGSVHRYELSVKTSLGMSSLFCCSWCCVVFAEALLDAGVIEGADRA